MKKAADIVKNKPLPFNVVNPTVTVSEALQVLNAMNRTYLVVMDGADYRGIFSEHDYVKKVAMPGWDPATCTVEEVMNKNAPSVTPDTSLEEILALMNTHHARYIPVFEGYKFAGVITFHHIIKLMLTEDDIMTKHEELMGSFDKLTLG
jgi:CBS domain-containing protein